jgi:hypothetical protein
MTSRIFDEKEVPMCNLLLKLWTDDQGQDIAVAVILVLVVGTVRLVGSNANTAFSSVASSLQYFFNRGHSYHPFPANQDRHKHGGPNA